MFDSACRQVFHRLLKENGGQNEIETILFSYNAVFRLEKPLVHESVKLEVTLEYIYIQLF